MYTFLYDDNFSDWDLGQVLYHINIASHVYIIIRVVSMEILIIGVCWRRLAPRASAVCCVI